MVAAYSSAAALVIVSIMSNEHNGKDGGLIMVIVSIMSNEHNGKDGGLLVMVIVSIMNIMSVMANMVFCWSWSS